jgi:hypothetical protein
VPLFHREDKQEKQKQLERFYALLKSLMDELFDYAPKSKHVKMPYNVSFGLIYDERDSVLLTGTDQNTGKKLYLYNVRIIGRMFEEKREQIKLQTLYLLGLQMFARYISARLSMIMLSTYSIEARGLPRELQGA